MFKPFRLSDADERKLVGVNPRLVAVVRRVAQVTPKPFVVAEGVRTLARQRQLLKQRKTKTLASKHLTGRAVDIYPIIDGKIPQDRRGYESLVNTAKAVAADMGVPMNFGHDWRWDSPHWELK